MRCILRNRCLPFLILSVGLLPAQPVNIPADYILGPGDEISIRVPDAEEINEKTLRIDLRGNVNLPMAGRLPAAGLTAEQLETEIARRLKRYMLNPDVSVTVKEFRSQPVSVLGAVQTPGVQQIQGRRTLFEVISTAGGLKPEAGNAIKITRAKQWGSIPLPSAKPDPTGQFSVAQVSVRSIMDARNPAENIQVMPNDVISVPKGDMIYVIGSVKKAGGFVLNERENMSVLQALSLAEGLDRMASPKSAKILRPSSGAAARLEIPVDIRKMLAGRTNDVPLQAEDILFVPNNAPKSAAMRTVEAAIQLGTGMMVYRRY